MLGANRENAKRSTGPRDRSLTRFNARRHGLLAGLTELDDEARYRAICSGLESQLKPISELEIALIQRIAFCLMRLDRAALIEAEIITARLHPPSQKPSTLREVLCQKCWKVLGKLS